MQDLCSKMSIYLVLKNIKGYQECQTRYSRSGFNKLRKENNFSLAFYVIERLKVCFSSKSEGEM